MIAFKVKVVLHVLLNFHSKQTKFKGVSLITENVIIVRVGRVLILIKTQ